MYECFEVFFDKFQHLHNNFLSWHWFEFEKKKCNHVVDNMYHTYKEKDEVIVPINNSGTYIIIV